MTPVLGVFCYNLPYVVFFLCWVFPILSSLKRAKNKPAVMVSITVDPEISGKNKSIKV